MKLSIIIINYKTPNLTVKCLDSVYNTTKFENFEIIVVDNNSEDNSREIITQKFPSIKWIANPINDGFGRANNLGVKHAIGNYLLFLNSDVVVKPNTIDGCLVYLKQNPHTGVLGCKLLNEDGSLQKSVYTYVGSFKNILKENLLYDYFTIKKEAPIDAIMGAFMLCPKIVFEKTNGFDPDFFMYAEELEWCYRVKKEGYQIKYYDLYEATHIHGASSQTNNNWSSKQNMLSNALLYLKIRGVSGYIIYHMLFVLNFLINFILLWKMTKEYRKYFWLSYSDYFSNIFYYLKIPFLYAETNKQHVNPLKRT